MVRPRKDQQIDIRGRAIEETIRLLGLKSISEITLQDVAAAVGCRAPALYNHFRNKDALLRAVHDAGFERLYREKMASVGSSALGPFERLRAGGIAYITFALENPSLYLLMFAPPAVVNDGLGNPFEHDLGFKSLELLRNAILACQAEGYLPAQDADIVAFTLWSTVHGAASLMLQNRSPVPESDGPDHHRMARDVIERVMGMIAATRSKRRADISAFGKPAGPRAVPTRQLRG